MIGRVFRVADSVESLNTAGRSLRVAGVGRVVEVQLDDRCRKLRSVESLKCSWTIVAGS